jgi:uncharacterized protein (DUF488 family)
MIGRQKLIMNLIDRAGGTVSRLHLVKWAFLFASESKLAATASFYQFLPYRFGPFSFTLYHEIDALIRDGYLIPPSENDLRIPTRAKKASWTLERELTQELDRFWSRYGKCSTQQLINTAYTRYPWFTVNSDHKERRAVSLPHAKCAIYTAGYEGLQVDGFLNLLLQAGIRQVLDVRNNPISRRYGFHKNTFAGLCQRLGISYQHMPELGIPSAMRSNLVNPSDYTHMFARYEKEILPRNTDLIHQVATAVKHVPSVLICQEADPHYCHRARLAKQVSKITGLPILDLRTIP